MKQSKTPKALPNYSAVVEVSLKASGEVIYVGHAVNVRRLLTMLFKPGGPLSDVDEQACRVDLVHQLPAQGMLRADLNTLVGVRQLMAVAKGHRVRNHLRRPAGTVACTCIDTGDCWGSLKTAAVVTGLMSTSINNVLKGRVETLHGRRWATAELDQVNQPRLSPLASALLTTWPNVELPVDVHELTADERIFIDDELVNVAKKRTTYAPMEVNRRRLMLAGNYADLPYVRLTPPLAYAVIGAGEVVGKGVVRSMNGLDELVNGLSSNEFVDVVGVGVHIDDHPLIRVDHTTCGKDDVCPRYIYEVHRVGDDACVYCGSSEQPIKRFWIHHARGGLLHGHAYTEHALCIVATVVGTRREVLDAEEAWTKRLLAEGAPLVNGAYGTALAPCTIAALTEGALTAKSHGVRCVETGDRWRSTAEAAFWTGVNQSNISGCAGGHRETAGGLHWAWTDGDCAWPLLSGRQRRAVDQLIGQERWEPRLAHVVYELVENDHVVYVGSSQGDYRRRLAQHVDERGKFHGRTVSIRVHLRRVCTQTEIVKLEERRTLELLAQGEPLENDLAGRKPTKRGLAKNHLARRRGELGDRVLECIDTGELYAGGLAVERLLGIGSGGVRAAADDPEHRSAGGRRWRWVRTADVDPGAVHRTPAGGDEEGVSEEVGIAVDPELVDGVRACRERYAGARTWRTGCAEVVMNGELCPLIDGDYVAAVYAVRPRTGGEPVFIGATMNIHRAWSAACQQVSTLAQADPRGYVVDVVGTWPTLAEATAAADQLRVESGVAHGDAVHRGRAYTRAQFERTKVDGRAVRRVVNEPGLESSTRRSADEVGNRYGRLTVVRPYELIKGVAIRWVCRCDCGNECVVNVQSLRSGTAKSCGCLRTETASAFHAKPVNHEHPKAYDAWRRMRRQLCKGPDGVDVADRWINADGFANFVADLGDPPEGCASLVLVDPGRTYAPGNCAWGAKQRRPRGGASMDPCRWRARVQWMNFAAKHRFTGAAAESFDAFIEEYGLPTSTEGVELVKIDRCGPFTGANTHWATLPTVEPGARFGRLTVVESVGTRWRCRCACGGEVTVGTHQLQIGEVTTCGRGCRG